MLLECSASVLTVYVHYQSILIDQRLTLGYFHTSTFDAHPGAIDVRVTRTRVRLKRVVLGTVQGNSSTDLLLMWTQSHQITEVNHY